MMIAVAMLIGTQFAVPRANAIDLGNLESIGLGFSLDTTYQYVSNGEVGGDIPTRGLYLEHNDFSIDAFTLSLEKVPTVGEGVIDLVGFRADVLFGEQAERLGFGFNSNGDGAVSPYQAYINVFVPSDAMSPMSLALRGEYVDDSEILDDAGLESGLEFYGFTSTLILTPFESMGNFETRLEYRYDKVDGDDAYFAGEDNQHGFAVQLLYWFDV